MGARDEGFGVWVGCPRVSNHTNFDGSKQKLPALKTRQAGEPNPYVIGKEVVIRYLTVVDECAQAGLARVTQ